MAGTVNSQPSREVEKQRGAHGSSSLTIPSEQKARKKEGGRR
jgi:hypothetical protein